VFVLGCPDTKVYGKRGKGKREMDEIEEMGKRRGWKIDEINPPKSELYTRP